MKQDGLRVDEAEEKEEAKRVKSGRSHAQAFECPHCWLRDQSLHSEDILR